MEVLLCLNWSGWHRIGWIELDWTGLEWFMVVCFLYCRLKRIFKEEYQQLLADTFCVCLFIHALSLDLAGAKGVDFVSGGSTEASCLISRKQSFRFIGISPQLQKNK